MADLGTISGRNASAVGRHDFDGPDLLPPFALSGMASGVGSQKTVPTWYGEPPPIGIGPTPTRSLSGRVMQRDDEGQDRPLAGARISLFHRKTRIHVARTRTNAQGYYRFDELMPGQNLYFAVAFDNEGLPVQNAMVLDLLTPE